DQLEADRKANMKGKAYTYVMIVGVATALQGQGHGRKLLRALIEESQGERVPIYLETETQQNVAFYQGLGFHMIRQVHLPIVGLPMWEMAREPGP
ncbi:MAG: GNAT family N-acetyltransferase, partial [Chloroflexi bacterium]|nr:GNAT family N-acetyltransferase [Chloroflexota bacterium]